ncbi:hypothetical protein P7C70_g3272, partial [Phenoliferia sp. Uapishka_3]
MPESPHTPHQATPYPSPTKPSPSSKTRRDSTSSNTSTSTTEPSTPHVSLLASVSTPGAPVKAKKSRRKKQSASASAGQASESASTSDGNLDSQASTPDASSSSKKSHAFSPKRSSSLSLAFTPIRTTLIEEDEEKFEDAQEPEIGTTTAPDASPSPPPKKAVSRLTNSVERMKSFEAKMRTPLPSPEVSPSKPHVYPRSLSSTAYLSPQSRRKSLSHGPHPNFAHLHPSPPSQRVGPSAARAPSSTAVVSSYPGPGLARRSSLASAPRNPLAHYDASGNPETEDAYYFSTPPAVLNSHARTSPSHSHSHHHQHASTPSPSRHPSVSQLRRQSTQHQHPHPVLSLALGLHLHQDESHIIEFTDSEAGSSVAGGGRGSDGEEDDGEEEDEYSSRPPSRIDDLMDFMASGDSAAGKMQLHGHGHGHGVRRRSLALEMAPDVPSTVEEEDEAESETNAVAAAKVGAGVGREDVNVCTSCGAQPQASFVALVSTFSCILLLDGSKTLTDAAPALVGRADALRPIESFGPAYESTSGGGILDALRDSLNTRTSSRLPPAPQLPQTIPSPPRVKLPPASTPPASLHPVPTQMRSTITAPNFVPGASQYSHMQYHSAPPHHPPPPGFYHYPLPQGSFYGPPPPGHHHQQWSSAPNYPGHPIHLPPSGGHPLQHHIFGPGPNPLPSQYDLYSPPRMHPLHATYTLPSTQPLIYNAPLPPPPGPPTTLPSTNFAPQQPQQSLIPTTPPRHKSTASSPEHSHHRTPTSASVNKTPVRRVRSSPRNKNKTPGTGGSFASGGTMGTPDLLDDSFSPDMVRRRPGREGSEGPMVGTPGENEQQIMRTPPKIVGVDAEGALSPHWNNSLGRTKYSTFKSPMEVQQLHDLKDPVDWPIVRLDNIPWDVTVAQIEDWLPKDSLAPIDQCILAVHILCNRADGRTLNQCYVEAASVTAARTIVRTRDGKKLLNRPVHITISTSSEFMNTLFPSWESGFNGLDPIPGSTPGPLLLQTEVTGLVSLCKLESPHACKVKERPYFNIVTILQKFPWHVVESYNSKAVVRLYNGACAAAEILGTVCDFVPGWQDILMTVVSSLLRIMLKHPGRPLLILQVDAVVACPAFRSSQKVSFLRATGMKHDKYPAGGNGHHSKESSGASGFSFSPTIARAGDSFVTVGSFAPDDDDDLSPRPSLMLDAAPHIILRQPSILNLRSPPEARPPKLGRTVSTPNLNFTAEAPRNDGSPVQKRRNRRLSSIARATGVPVTLVAQIASQLDIPNYIRVHGAMGEDYEQELRPAGSITPSPSPEEALRRHATEDALRPLVDLTLKQWSFALLSDHPFEPPRSLPPYFLHRLEQPLTKHFLISKLCDAEVEKWCLHYLVWRIGSAIGLDLNLFAITVDGELVQVAEGRIEARECWYVRTFEELGLEAKKKLGERWCWKERL